MKEIIGIINETNMRAPYQILVFPYYKTDKGQIEYCIFKRKDLNVWQGIAGGGVKGESSLEAAERETFEEAEITSESKMFQLNSVASIPVEAISGFIWGDDTLVIPEYSFAVEVSNKNVHLHDEHTKYKWVTYEEAMSKLKWDSNRTALWELNHRLTKNKLKNTKNVI